MLHGYVLRQRTGENCESTHIAYTVSPDVTTRTRDRYRPKLRDIWLKCDSLEDNNHV